MTFEEWWDRPEGCGATPDTYKGWEKSCHAAWKAGVASRDAEVAELKRLQVAYVIDERDELSEQVTLLRDVVKKSRLLLKHGKGKESILSIDVVKLCDKALAATEPKP